MPVSSHPFRDTLSRRIVRRWRKSSRRSRLFLPVLALLFLTLLLGNGGFSTFAHQSAGANQGSMLLAIELPTSTPTLTPTSLPTPTLTPTSLPTAVPNTGDARSDLGDAPDSTFNHPDPDISNTAYPSTPGRFPTVWGNTPSSEPSGPIHFDPYQVWLGDRVTTEQDADTGPDTDPQNNILAGGADTADNDGADDGWLNRPTPNTAGAFFGDCRETTLRVRIAKAPNAQVQRMFLNVWFDGTRDGDWADTRLCPDGQRTAHEWVVQNFPVNTSAISTTFQDITVPTFLVLNAKPGDAAWMRFTLSDQPAPRNADVAGTTGIADGRGPSFPNGFALGETEDYLYQPPQTSGQPGQVTMSKNAFLPTDPPQPSSGPFEVGSEFIYGIEISHSGGTAPALIKLGDRLPPELRFVGDLKVTELAPSAGPLVAAFDPGAAPKGAVKWDGSLAPNARVRISFKVRVELCPQPNPNEPNSAPSIRNLAIAEVRQTNGELLGEPRQASSTVTLNCRPPTPPELNLQKRVVVAPAAASGQPSLATVNEGAVEAGVASGQEAGYVLTLGGISSTLQTTRISDTLPSGLLAVETGANHGVAQIINSGQVVVWDGDVGPGIPPPVVKIRVKLTEQVRCNDRLVNEAEWATRLNAGKSNPTTLIVVCQDLGDAPDSSNHFSKPMEAYSGVPANFPTVFDGAEPRGPRHMQPRPLHLGRGVSAEMEADAGTDADGPHNIEPLLGRPDLDQSDDGLIREKLSLSDCKVARIPVLVSIDPSVAASLQESKGIAFINAWLDSNRDGDWSDTFTCAGQNQPAREHILIDAQVDTSKLRPGVQELLLETSGPVSWPQDRTDKPAWLRISLSDRPSNKTLPEACSGSACTYGDGRGYADSFRFGETEDYLFLPVAGNTAGADPTIAKRGQVIPFYNPETKETVWRVNWQLEYKNVGYGVATNVRVLDRLAAPQTFVSTRPYPPIPFTANGPSTEFAVGTLNPGQSGFIGIQASVPFNTAPGTVLTNTVEIRSANDSNAGNNTAVVTTTIPILPPIITSPTPGTTCDGQIIIIGRAHPGAQVDVLIDNSKVGSATVGADGSWSYPATLTDGSHTISAVLRVGANTSVASPAIEVIVDSSLSWSPLSLRFTDQNGNIIIPRDSEGRTDETGWRIRLRPNTVYTATVRICCDAPDATVSLDVPGVGTVSMTDTDGDSVFSATFQTGDQATLNAGNLRICVVCQLIQRCSDGQVLIDPLGVVYDAQKGQQAGLLAGATVACYQQNGNDGTSTFNLWSAADFGQKNPQVTGSDGYFSFFTPPGIFQLDVRREGYQPFRSGPIVVTDSPVEYNVPLTPNPAKTATYTIAVGENGFVPSVLRVPPGAVVAWINVAGSEHTATSTPPTLEVGANLAATGVSWDSGLISAGDTYSQQFDTTGTYTFYDQQNPTNSATIIVEVPAIYVPMVGR